jgi:hypothetical protein
LIFFKRIFAFQIEKGGNERTMYIRDVWDGSVSYGCSWEINHLLSFIFLALSFAGCDPAVANDEESFLATNSLSVSPFFSAESDTIFLLYTRRNPMNPQVLKLNDVESMSDSNFNVHDQIR